MVGGRTEEGARPRGFAALAKVLKAPRGAKTEQSQPNPLWKEAYDPRTGRKYFWNADTRERVWEIPGALSRSSPCFFSRRLPPPVPARWPSRRALPSSRPA